MGSPRRDVGAWTRLGVKKLTLGPGEVRDVAVKVRVPKSVSAGEHLGGIVAENTKLKRGPTKSRGRGRFRINVRNLAVTAVQVNLPGPRVRKLSLGSVKSGGSQGGNQTVLVGIANEGNVLLSAARRKFRRGEGVAGELTNVMAWDWQRQRSSSMGRRAVSLSDGRGA